MKHRLTNLIAPLLFFASCGNVEADLLTYSFSGKITEIRTNSNGVIPNLAIGDTFVGFTTFESAGWQQTEGVVFVSLNGVDLLFDGPFIYGAAEVTPLSHYSIRIAGDTFGNIGDSTFSAGNFGPELEDSDGSAGHTSLFPESLNLTEFETNVFRIWGTYVSTGDLIFVTGRLFSFTAVPEPTSGTTFLLLTGASILLGRKNNFGVKCDRFAVENSGWKPLLRDELVSRLRGGISPQSDGSGSSRELGDEGVILTGGLTSPARRDYSLGNFSVVTCTISSR